MTKAERRGKYTHAGKGVKAEKSSDKGVTVDDALAKMENMTLEEAKVYTEGDTRKGITSFLEDWEEAAEHVEETEEEESEEEEAEEDDKE